MKNTKTKRMLAVAALLAVGLALMLYYAAHKQGYHVDELYTYELANYPGGFYALEDGYMDSWHDGSFYSAALTPGRLFDYTIPWNNQKIDVHPPLYYCLIYTAESLFPQLGLPWWAAAELCLHPGGRGGAVLHGKAADRAVLARVDGGGLLAALRRRAGHGGVHPDVQPDDAGGHRAFVLPCGFVAGAAGGAKAAAGGLAGSVCGHNGRGADAVFLFGVLLFSSAGCSASGCWLRGGSRRRAAM